MHILFKNINCLALAHLDEKLHNLLKDIKLSGELPLAMYINCTSHSETYIVYLIQRPKIVRNVTYIGTRKLHKLSCFV